MDMKQNVLKLTLILFLLAPFVTEAQISHGGRPLSYTMLRSTFQNIFQEMPSFDIDAEIQLDSLMQNDLRGGYRFAYKFMTDYTPENSGQSFFLADGTRVWRLGIRSKGAYSINLLFTEFEIPKGAKLFLYSPDQSQVLGSFTYLNNSELNLLPVAPVYGDEVIIEYQEPVDVDFAGRLKVGEVNHAYRDLRGSEPAGVFSQYDCMPSPVCASDTTDKYDEIVRSVVLLIINGDVLCSGVMINNSRNDGTPYILTASHCLNKQFTMVNPDYIKMANTVVSFFNYESPFCSKVLRGTEELSMASTHLRAINEKTDMALLELLEKPPVYYRPYYAGWNINETTSPPYTNIHHPGGGVKCLGICTKDINLKSYSGHGFNPNSHWNVLEWETGSTAGGSSGSPLFDSKNHIIGALTGGNSSCSSPKDDLFFALHKTWLVGDVDSLNLKPWLSPNGNQLICEGLDPYETNKAIELSNLQASGNRELSEIAYLPVPMTGQQFGVNSLNTTEYAESFTIPGTATLWGAYFVTPEISNNTSLSVEVKVYSSTTLNEPADPLFSTTFSPTYTNKQILNEDFQETVKPLNRAQESFIKFEPAVSVSDKFFISYKITASEKDSFTVYTLPSGSTQQNTAWLKYQDKWIENTEHPVKPYSTSLFITPVVQMKTGETSNQKTELTNIRLSVDRNQKRIRIIIPGNINETRYDIFSIDGKVIQNGKISDTTEYFYLKNHGCYIIRLKQGNKLYTSKFVL